VETIGSKRSYTLTWCVPNNDDDDDREGLGIGLGLGLGIRIADLNQI